MHGLKYVSWGDHTGYAIAAKSYLRALMRAEVPLTWAPMMPGPAGYELHPGRDWPCAELAVVCNRPVEYDTVLIHTVPEYYPAWIRSERQTGRRVFGYTVWELESLPGHWPPILNELDAVLVPCRWNVEVFRRSGVTVPIHVVPHLSQFEAMPAPSDAARAALRTRLGAKGRWQDRFVFYTIGYWSNRKAPDLALRAYWQAFTADDPVTMVVKTSTGDITRWRRHWRNGFRRRHPSPEITAARMARQLRRPAPWIVVADERLDDAEVLALHEIGDCYVSLARAEGWGLGTFEAARLGKPVVSTLYGGQRDYLRSGHCWTVGHEMVPVYEPTWSDSYKPGDRWAEPSLAEAAAALRSIYDNPMSASERGRALGEAVRREFSPAQTLQALVDALR